MPATALCPVRPKCPRTSWSSAKMLFLGNCRPPGATLDLKAAELIIEEKVQSPARKSPGGFRLVTLSEPPSRAASQLRNAWSSPIPPSTAFSRWRLVPITAAFFFPSKSAG